MNKAKSGGKKKDWEINTGSSYSFKVEDFISTEEEDFPIKENARVQMVGTETDENV